MMVITIVATIVGLTGVPSFYAPIKEAADARPNQDAYAYVGAVKTSTKEKKVFVKKEEVKAAPVEEAMDEPVEETAEEAPVENTEE